MGIPLSDFHAMRERCEKNRSPGALKRLAADIAKLHTPDAVALKAQTTDAAPGVYFCIRGQIRGGKNNMVVTRTGRHFPKPEWARWRDDAVRQVKAQIKPGFEMFTEPVNVRLTYFAGDKRRRDQPAILDAIFHVLEKAGIVEDDTLVWVSQSSRHYDKTEPCAVITFL